MTTAIDTLGEPVRTVEGPTVSVVIPVYNQARFLPSAIESVLAQTYRPVDLIVVNDGSTDDIAQALAPYRDRVRVIEQPNRGAANALNRGLKAATGDLVCWLSADDAYLADKVRAQVAAFVHDPGLGLSCTGFDVIDGDDRLIRSIPVPSWPHPDPFVAVFWRNPINGSTVMIRRDVLEAVGPFDETLRADVDADMWLRLADRYPIRQIDGVHMRYRVHGASLSADRSLMRESMTRVRLRRLDDGTLIEHLRRTDPDSTVALLARMSAEYAMRGLRDLARALLEASRSQGGASAWQVVATGALGLSRWSGGQRLAMRVVGRLRRAYWRSRASTDPRA